MYFGVFLFNLGHITSNVTVTSPPSDTMIMIFMCVCVCYYGLTSFRHMRSIQHALVHSKTGNDKGWICAPVAVSFALASTYLAGALAIFPFLGFSSSLHASPLCNGERGARGGSVRTPQMLRYSQCLTVLC